MDQDTGNGKKKVVSQITITLYEDSGVSVEGPINDNVLFYGMIEKARDAVFEKQFMDKYANMSSGGFKRFMRGIR